MWGSQYCQILWSRQRNHLLDYFLADPSSDLGSQQQKPLRVTSPLGNRLHNSLRSHPRWQWGRCGLKCPHSLMGPWEPHILITLNTWDFERDLLVYSSSQQNDIQQSFATSDFASRCDSSLTPRDVLSCHTSESHPNFAACNVANVHGMLPSSDSAMC